MCKMSNVKSPDGECMKHLVQLLSELKNVGLVKNFTQKKVFGKACV